MMFQRRSKTENSRKWGADALIFKKWGKGGTYGALWAVWVLRHNIYANKTLILQQINYSSNNLFLKKFALQEMNFFSKCKYKIYKKAKITMTNIIYQNKKSDIYIVKG